MPAALPFLLVALAVFRVAWLVAIDDGPWQVCLRLRSWVAARYGYLSWQTAGVSCPVCVSFWLGWVGAALIASTVVWYAVTALALSAVTVVIVKVRRDG